MREPQPPRLDLGETQPLRGKIAVITGTSRGIGAEIAKSLARAGVDIVGTHVDPKKAKRQAVVATEVEAAGVTFTSILADITEPADREVLLQGAIASETQQPRNIDYLILNAAGGLEEGKSDDWAERINIDAQLALVDQFLPHMAGGGKIIYLTSLWAHRYGEVKLLPGYEPVARTKNEAERKLRERVSELNERGVSLGILSGHVIKGTAAHLLLNRFYQERIADLQQTAKGGRFPEVSEMGDAVLDMLLMNFDSGYTHYVGGTQAEALEPLVVRTLAREQIQRLLPMYGDGKLYVDAFTTSDDGKSGIGKYIVREDDVEGHFAGEFADIQLFRGVDQVEAAAQALGLTHLTSQSETGGLGFYRGVGNVRFEGMIFPGDEIEMTTHIVRETPHGIVGNCEIKVGDQIVTTIEGMELALIPNIRIARILVGRQRASRKNK